MNNIYDGFTFVKGLSINNPTGTIRTGNKNDNKSFISYRIVSYPKNFTENLILEISTNIEKGQSFKIIIYDIDSVSMNNKKNPSKDTKIINKSYDIKSEKFQLSIPFNQSAQANAWKDKEFKMAECYLEISSNKIKTDYSEVFLVEKSKNPNTNNQSEIKIIKKPLNLTKEQQNNFMAAVLVETSGGRKALWDISWIYFNLVQTLGFEKGLKRSSAYNLREKNYMFKAHLYFLGNGEKYSNDVGVSPSNWDDYKIKDYVNIGPYKSNCKDSVLDFKEFAEKNIFSNKPMTLYDGWEGQGNTDDMNIDDGRYDKVWEKARQYYWLQRRKQVSKIFVKKLYDGEHTSYIYDTKNIMNYFKSFPNKLPNTNEIPKIPHYDKYGDPYKYDSNGKPTPAILDTYGGLKN